jgi:hypothetical protein
MLDVGVGMVERCAVHRLINQYTSALCIRLCVTVASCHDNSGQGIRMRNDILAQDLPVDGSESIKDD